MATLADQISLVVARIAEEFVDVRGDIGLKVYIQSTEPSWASGEKALWINTTGGNLQFIIQTGA